MAFFKALIPGIILTLVVSIIIGSNGSSAGFLDIHAASFQGQGFYWSWPLFFAATGLSWGILWMME
ncbi:MAG: hypothetical protein KDE21_07445 [Novosphingobium sp.]|nr:hypothetical protein [Novosphingobium sp.]